MHLTSKTLQQMLWQSVDKFANKDCFSFVDGEPITYAQLGQTVKDIQQLLTDLDVKPQDKVAILSANMPNWGAVYLATVSMGAVAVPLLPDFSAKEIENVLNHSDSKVVFTSHRLQAKLDEIEVPNVEVRISIENFFVYRSKAGVTTGNEVSSYEVKPTDLAAIIYTSGTTGKSKGVMLSHRNLMAELEGIYDMEPVESDDTFLSILPLAHTYENSLGLLTPVFRGATVYYLEKAPTPSILMPALAKIRPSYMLTVPMIIEKVFKNKVLPELAGNRFTRVLYMFWPTRVLMHRIAGKKLYKSFGGRLRFFGIGGAKLDPKVERFLLDAKVFPYAIGYGLTETAPLLAGANPRKVKHQSTGTPMLGIALKINEPNENGEGEIYAKGPSVMMGYYKDQALTSEVFTNDGWFKTGDLGAFDTQGNLYIKGRLKNVILGASGENIYPEEIESVINNFRFVTESLVVEQKGRLVAMVRFSDELECKIRELRTNAEQYVEQLKQELITYVNSQVSRFSQISVVVALQNDFEKTSTQKIKRFLYTNHLV
ncbi:MAG: AMP-binding protein [Prevotellaceae bacterium]|jgi:long-chain acyl-CoA synthetase|nr:AMP-binding protein [Prevotellaceae bacterium]